MFYSCRDIDKVIESDFNLQFSEEVFLHHVESCRDCRAHLDLQPKLEEQLRGLLLTPAPRSFSAEVMQTILTESFREKGLRAAAAFRLLATAVLLLSSAMILFLNRGIAVRTVESLKVRALLSQALDSLRSFGPGGGRILTQLLKAFESPLLLTAVAATTVLVFIFSIMKLKEAAE